MQINSRATYICKLPLVLKVASQKLYVGMCNLMKWVRRIGYEVEDPFPEAAEESEGTAALLTSRSNMRPKPKELGTWNA